MEIIRNAKENEHVPISTDHLFNKRLSAKAKGVMSYLLTMPGGWHCSINELMNNFKDGRDSIRGALLELEKEGYLKREDVRKNDGKIDGKEYILSEKPREGARS